MMKGDPSDKLTLIDPLYVYPLVGGITAYILGSLTACSVYSCYFGVLSQDLFHLFWLNANGVSGTVNFGGAGVFDSVVIAGLVAILLAELFGEARERLQGGPVADGHDPELLQHLNSDLKIEGEAGEQENKEEESNNEEKICIIVLSLFWGLSFFLWVVFSFITRKILKYIILLLNPV